MESVIPQVAPFGIGVAVLCYTLYSCYTSFIWFAWGVWCIVLFGCIHIPYYFMKGKILYQAIYTWYCLLRKYPRSINISYPPGIPGIYCSVFPPGTLQNVACQSFASGIFLVLTGIHWECSIAASNTKLSVTSSTKSEPTIPKVYYVYCEWNEQSILGENNSLYHAFVFCNGFIYQSYCTKVRHNASAGYPPILVKLNDTYANKFKNGDFSSMTVEDFNRICAPQNAQIENTSAFRSSAKISGYLDTPLKFNANFFE